MHAAAPGRRIVSFATTAIVLIPVGILALGFTTVAGPAELMETIVRQTSLASIGLVVALLMFTIGLAWRKGVAALPFLIVMPLAMGVGWTSMMLRPQQIDSSSQPKKEPPSLSVSSRFHGVEVWCNGVRLGETPLKMTLAEFDQKVAPTDLRPDQPSVFVYEPPPQPSFSSAQFSAIPGDPHRHRQRDYPYNESNVIVMKWLAGQKYWWSFRLNGYNVQMTSLSFGQSNDDVRCSIDGYWKTLERHASLLKTLAEHENVDPLIACADHIAAWSPPLKQFLEYRPEDAPEPPPHIHFRDQFSRTPLEFTEAVYR